MIEVYIRDVALAGAARIWCRENIGPAKNMGTGEINWFYSILDIRYFRIRDSEAAAVFKLIWG